eukprot:TRINITY_DN918_c0_g1_i2.p1 TRINITY_DN918_c0_g1~~TRINITY_DN918_c0_g1_i2.p1  ORF type:complete len:116 (+),score=19.40 TRINITY_DN918_c0_g1_i2:329-676(+)
MKKSTKSPATSRPNHHSAGASLNLGEDRSDFEVLISLAVGLHRLLALVQDVHPRWERRVLRIPAWNEREDRFTILMRSCLLYTSDAADEEDSVDLGGRRIIKKKKKKENEYGRGR